MKFLIICLSVLLPLTSVAGDESDNNNIFFNEIRKNIRAIETDRNSLSAHQEKYIWQLRGNAHTIEENNEASARRIKELEQNLEASTRRNQDLEEGLDVSHRKNIELEEALSIAVDKHLRDQYIDFIFSGVIQQEWLPTHMVNMKAESISYIFIDLDHFGMVNSTFGHDEADIILMRFANSVKSYVDGVTRKGESFVGRKGGDEFFVILLNTPVVRAAEIAETIRASTEKNLDLFKEIPKNPEHIVEEHLKYKRNYMTLSIGVARMSLDIENLSLENARQAIKTTSKSSDAEMYKSKWEGRNRINYTRTCDMIFSQ